MSDYIGEYECKADDKGRVIIPAGLKRQIPKDSLGKMVINRGFDKCLTLFTRDDWKKESEKLKNLNDFNKKDRRFKRLFNSGATEVKIDNASRILIPKKLAAYAELESVIVFYAYENKIDVWSKKTSDFEMEVVADDFSDMAEEVMAKRDDQDNE
jgi:MraZ protein